MKDKLRKHEKAYLLLDKINRYKQTLHRFKEDDKFYIRLKRVINLLAYKYDRIIESLTLISEYVIKAKKDAFKVIKKVVCKYLDIPIEYIDLKTRKREIVKARQLCHYFANKYKKGSLATIGYAFGKKDHATVLHSCSTVNNLMDTDKKYSWEVKRIDELIIKAL